MRFLKTIIGVQTLVIMYLFWENNNINGKIIESADAVSKSTKRIERLNDELDATRRSLGNCIFELDKYSEFQINQQENNGP